MTEESFGLLLNMATEAWEDRGLVLDLWDSAAKALLSEMQARGQKQIEANGLLFERVKDSVVKCRSCQAEKPVPEGIPTKDVERLKVTVILK